MQLTQQEMIVLRKTFLFHRLTPAAYMKLSEGRFTGAFRQELRTGQMLEWPQGQEHCLGVVIAGELTELRAPAFPNRSLREGSVMGVMELFSNQRPMYQPVRAETRSRVLFFSAQQIRSLFESYPDLMMRYINFLTARAQELRWEYLMAATPAAQDRVKKYCAMEMEQGPEGQYQLTRSMSALARRLHMSRSTLYRALEQLQQQGLLLRQEREIIILSPQALGEALEGPKP